MSDRIQSAMHHWPMWVRVILFPVKLVIMVPALVVGLTGFLGPEYDKWAMKFFFCEE